MEQAFIPSISVFQPHQIVCLEHEMSCLYAEVVQVATKRQICWVRPLLLSETLVAPSESDRPIVYDLRQGADLLWPVSLFRPALDTEVIPLLVQLETADREPESFQIARQQFNCFIQQVWQAYKSEFQAS
ncbi:MAG: hypothetical protein KME06_03185 [Kastovskya adunca ATA6-11-RM4]|nr:hypothetical protein [Kastovskya adunca ATA6-11-RM4]